MFPNPVRSGLTLTKVIGGMSKTLNVVNQLIPLYKEAKPMLSNAQNAFKIAKEFMTYSSPKTKNETSLPSSNRPVFFV